MTDDHEAERRPSEGVQSRFEVGGATVTLKPLSQRVAGSEELNAVPRGDVFLPNQKNY